MEMASKVSKRVWMIITQTPLRISLFGGGTDFPDYYLNHGGCVLSTAIDKYIYVIIKKRFDRKIRIGYTKTEMVDSVDEIEHDLIRESLRMTDINQGIEISTMADIPSEGSGLGSSSSVTVGALHAMCTYKNKLVTANALAELTCMIEIDNLESPIGKQDQYITAYGGFRFIEFEKNGRVIVNPVLIDDKILNRLNQNLMLFYTGITRKTNDILKNQKRNTKKNLGILHEMEKLTHSAYHELLNHRIDVIGELLHENWQLKKLLSNKISNPELDDIYYVARKYGALGGKISGAGGGGFFLLYCPQEKQNDIRHALSPLQELPFNINADGTKVIFNHRR